jgi:hypothetical protein
MVEMGFFKQFGIWESVVYVTKNLICFYSWIHLNRGIGLDCWVSIPGWGRIFSLFSSCQGTQ